MSKKFLCDKILDETHAAIEYVYKEVLKFFDDVTVISKKYGVNTHISHVSFRIKSIEFVIMTDGALDYDIGLSVFGDLSSSTLSSSTPSTNIVENHYFMFCDKDFVEKMIQIIRERVDGE